MRLFISGLVLYPSMMLEGVGVGAEVVSDPGRVREVSAAGSAFGCTSSSAEHDLSEAVVAAVLHHMLMGRETDSSRLLRKSFKALFSGSKFIG